MQMLQTLLPIGQRLYLKLESHSAAVVLRRLTVDVHVNDLGDHALQVHLSAPNVLHPEKGKVFVVCLVCRMNGAVRSMRGSTSEVLLVDPWELLMQPGERKVFKFMSV
jgi:tRNA-binding EMAP/Myf-like protein